MVLGFVLVTSWMLVQILNNVRAEIALRGVEEQNDALQSLAFQTLEIVIGVVAEIRQLDGGLYSPAQGWGDPFRYAGFASEAGTNGLGEAEGADSATPASVEMADFAFPSGIRVDVTIRDESGRLPLNQTPAERWQLLFEAMEIQAADVATLTDALLDWIDVDGEPRLNGAEAELYQRREPPYLAANGPITDLHQLYLIEGFDRLFFDAEGVPNELFQTLRECVTLLPVALVNYNSAPPLVLEVLAEEREFEARQITEYLAGPDLERGTGDDRVLRPDIEDADLPLDSSGNPLDFSATCRYLAVHIAAQSAGTAFRLAATLDTESLPPKGIYPMTILDLQTKGADL